MDELTGKTFGVLGLARSGIACAEVLTALGAAVILYDGKPLDQIASAVEAAAKLGLKLHANGEPIDYARLDVLITSPGVPKRSPALQGAIAAGVPVWGEIEAAYRIAKAPIVAITGTNGKTTTTVLVAEMIKASDRKAFIAGNIAAGEIALPLIKAASQANADDVIVAEISSFQLEWTEQFRPRVGAILNITPDHGDRQSWDEYVEAKWNLFQAQQPGDLAITRDDVPADPKRRPLPGRSMTFSASEADRIVSEVLPLEDVKLPGRHNRENLAAAILMARELGVSDAAIGSVAANFGGVVHRLEYAGACDGVTYINNSMCTNVDAFARSLEAISAPKVVIAGGVYKGDDLQPIADAVTANAVRKIVLIGRSAAAMSASLRANGYTEITIADSLYSAVAIGQDAAIPGDTVMLAPACASFDMFKDFEDRGDQFKAAVRELCKAHR